MKKLHLPLSFVLLLGSALGLRSQSNLWGVTTSGGNGGGSIFGMPAGSTAISSQYDFSDYSGSNTTLNKLTEVNGKFYGSTTAGGAGSNGVVFEYDPSVNTYKVLFSLTGASGAYPGGGPGPLIRHSSNSHILYGTNKISGAGNFGNIFAYDLTTNTYSVLASFTGTAAPVFGNAPAGGLIEGSDGNLYGMTNRGGVGPGLGSGVIFNINPVTGTYTALAQLTTTMGTGPQGYLIEGAIGKLYGLTLQGGTNNAGVLFEYDFGTSTYTKKFDFLAATGSLPIASLVKASNGKLYGTTLSGGTNNCGVVFEYDLTSGYAKDADFTAATTGSMSNSALIQSSNGKLYGTAKGGGANNLGTIFDYDITLNALTKDYDMTSANGSNPQSSFAQSSVDGKFYSIAQSGGNGGASSGTIFSFDPSTSTFSKTIDLNVSSGGQPQGGMVFTNNKLYGTTVSGGAAGSSGVIYEYDYSLNSYAKKAEFSAATGPRYNYGAFMLAADGNLYGLSAGGGANSIGSIYRYTPGTTTFTKLYDLTAAGGSAPYGHMVQAPGGLLYGLTSTGGANGVGTLFSYNGTTNAFTDLYDFSTGSGASPFGSPVIASNGKIYGMTSAGGANGSGVIFEYDITTSTYTKKADLSLANGAAPYGSLVQANGNFLYGMTSAGGANSAGAIFEYDITNGTYSKKADLTTANGSAPRGSMIKAANGKLYGMTTAGGSNGVGAMFEYDPSTVTYTKKMDLSTSTGNLPGYSQLTEICTFPAAASALNVDNTAICQGNSTAQNFSISTIGNATSYSIALPAGATVNSGANTNAQVVNLGGVAAGVYTVTAGGINACGTGTLSSKTITVNSLPIISAPDGTICSGTSFVINPTGATTYSVEGGSLTVSPGSSATYTLNGTDGNGCSAAAPFTVSVQVKVSPNITVNSGAICDGDTYVFNPIGADTYTISGGNFTVSPSITSSYNIVGTSTNGCTYPGTVVATVTVNTVPTISVNTGSICSGSSFSLMPSGADTYTLIGGGSFNVSPGATAAYSVIGTSSAGCAASNTATTTIIVSQTPSITVSSGSICSGDTYVINTANANSYTITGNTFSVQPAITATYQVVGANTDGCVSDPVISTVTVYQTPTVAAAGGSVCSGAIFTIMPSGADTYSFATGSVSNVTVATGNFTTNPAANMTYSVWGISNAGCPGNGTVTVSLTLVASPSITVNSGSICAGQFFTIDPQGGADSYAVTGNNFNVSPSLTATYLVIGSSTTGCLSDAVTSTVTVVPLPNITASSGTICSGNSYIIVPGGAISAYTITGGSFTVSPLATTPFTVSGSDATGCVGQAVANVLVNPSPTVIANSGTICAGDQFTINPNGADSYTINSSNGTFIVSPATSTVYTIVGTTTAGCITAPATTVSVTVNALPPVAVNAPTAICIGKQATLTASGANSYNWLPGNFPSATLIDSPTTTADYSVTGTDLNGCSATVTVSVLVNSLPSIVMAGGAVCPGNSFTFNPTGAITYTYSSGSNTVAPANTATYSVTGTDANGCTSTLAVVATVTVTTNLPVNISGPAAVCSGSNATLIGGGAATYSWSTGDQTANITVSPTSNTDYTVVGSSGSCSNSAVVTLSVLAAPTLSLLSTDGPTICAGETITLTAQGATSYTWMNTSQNTSSIAVTPTIATTYTVMGASSNGCTGTISYVQAIDPCLGIASLNNQDAMFKAYPNPNNGEFSVEVTKEMDIVIINVLGEIVSAQHLQAGKNSLDISRQAKGLYFIQSLNNRQAKTVRIAVQ